MKRTSLNDPYLIQRNDQTNKDGTKSILLRINIHGRKKDLSTKVACPEGFFDPIKGKIKKSYPDSDNLNLLIEKHLRKAKDIVFKAKVNDLPLTLDDFLKQYQGIQTNNDFYAFIQNEIDLEKKKTNKASSTIGKYEYHLTKLKKFRAKLSFNEITESYLANFEAYMRDDLKNQKNSSNNSLKFIRKFLNVAISKGITDVYPFKNYKLKDDKNLSIKYLTEEEFKKLKDHFNCIDRKHKHYRALKSFIFSCYTGLRYGDAKRLTLSHIINDVIHIKMQKTGKQVEIPLLSEAKKLINFSLAPGMPNLNTPSTQYYNRKLKDIETGLGFKIHLTSHVARHTAATMLLNNGIPIETVQSILGHTDIKQTQQYAKLWSKTKIDQFKLVDGMF